jgi:hypothetical protein
VESGSRSPSTRRNGEHAPSNRWVLRDRSFGDWAALLGGLTLIAVGVWMMIQADTRSPSVFGGMTVICGIAGMAPARTPPRRFRTRWTKARDPLMALGLQALFAAFFAAGGEARPALMPLLPLRLVADAFLVVAAAWFLLAMPPLPRPQLPVGTHAPHLVGEGPWWSRGGHRATCSCAWVGKPRTDKARAINDYRIHEASASSGDLDDQP